MTNLFSDPTKTIPKQIPDAFIVRVPMDANEIGGRKIPGNGPSAKLQLSHTGK